MRHRVPGEIWANAEKPWGPPRALVIVKSGQTAQLTALLGTASLCPAYFRG